MDLHDYLRVLRKRWRVLALTLTVTVGLAVAYTTLSSNVYAASTQFFVSTSGGDNAASLQQGNTFTQQRVKSYAQLLESPKVLNLGSVGFNGHPPRHGHHRGHRDRR